MALKLKLHAGHRTGLIAECDICGKQIEDGEANICWMPNPDEKVGDTFPFRIACKDPCTLELDRRYGHQYTQELSAGIGYLLNNSGISVKQMQRDLVLLAMID